MVNNESGYPNLLLLSVGPRLAGFMLIFIRPSGEFKHTKCLTLIVGLLGTSSVKLLNGNHRTVSSLFAAIKFEVVL